MPKVPSLCRIAALSACAFSLLGAMLPLAAQTPAPAAEAPANPAPVPLLERIVVIGASVSDGFVLDELTGGPRTAEYRFGRYLDAALAAPHGKIITHANRMLFMAPASAGETQVNLALEARPSLVVAIDYLFWFCYGRMDEEARLGLLDAGLEQLERLQCPVVVGDIPDAAAAAGGILSRNQVPRPETIVKANERLHAWVKAHPNAVLVPLAEFMKICQSDGPLKVGSVEWPAGKSRALLQRDSLHPARHGCAALALAAADALIKSGKLEPAQSVQWDAEKVFEQAVSSARLELALRDAEKAAGKAAGSKAPAAGAPVPGAP